METCCCIYIAYYIYRGVGNFFVGKSTFCLIFVIKILLKLINFNSQFFPVNLVGVVTSDHVAEPTNSEEVFAAETINKHQK